MKLTSEQKKVLKKITTSGCTNGESCNPSRCVLYFKCGTPPWGTEEIHNEAQRLLGKKSKNKIDVIYLIRGIGCDNRELVDTEKEMKDKMPTLQNDDDWDGDIIGYKCIPIYKVQTTTKLIKIKEDSK
jgi:hypothetical protein